MKASTYNVATGKWELNDSKSIKDELTGIVDPSTAPTLGESANASSTLPANTYYVVYTWVNQHGETYFSPEANFTTSAGYQLDVTLPTFPSNAVSANVYMSTVSGEETKQGNTTTTTYAQTTALVVGAALPIENTSDHTIVPNEIGILSQLSTTNKTSLVSAISEVKDEGISKQFYQTSALPSTPSNGWIRQLTADFTTPGGQSFKAGDIVVYIDSVGEWRFLVDVLNELQTVTIPYGLSKIETDQKTPLAVKMKGKTVINHVPLFDSGLWTFHANTTVNSPSKITINADATSNLNYILFNVKANTDYTVNLKHNGQIGIYNADASSSIVVYTTAQTINFNTGTNEKIRIYLKNTNSTAGTFTFENVMLNEGSNAQEFVANVKHIQNPVVVSYGKNLTPQIAGYDTIHDNATILKPYQLKLESTGNWQGTTVTLDVLPNTTYAGQVTLEKSGGTRGGIWVSQQDKDKNEITATWLAYTDVDGTYDLKGTITTASNCVYLRFDLNNNGAGTFIFTNPQLELGSVATTFEAHNPTYLYGAYDQDKNPILLGSNLDGSVADQLYYSDENNRDEVLRRFKLNEVLDGSLAWVYSLDYTGFKRVQLTGGAKNYATDLGNNGGTIVKYDGKILPDLNGTWDSGDKWAINASEDVLITISDTNSGWTDAMSPTAKMIKGYFYGWKYTGDGATHSWVSIVDGSSSPTQTEDYVSTNMASGFTPYKLSYQLKNSVVEPVTVEGDLTLIDGLNQVSLDSGVIVREKANPVLNGVNQYVINTTSLTDSLLDKRVLKVLQVYENGKEFNQYTTDGTNAYGNERIVIKEVDYDPTASYTVTYLVLDKHLFTANPVSAEGTYNTNLKTVVDKHTDQIADLNTKQSQQDIWNDKVAIKGEGEVIQRGTATISVSASTTGSVNVTFPRAFATIPKILATVVDAYNWSAVSLNTTTTGTTIFVKVIDETARTSTVLVDWIAIG